MMPRLYILDTDALVSAYARQQDGSYEGWVFYTGVQEILIGLNPADRIVVLGREDDPVFVGRDPMQVMEDIRYRANMRDVMALHFHTPEKTQFETLTEIMRSQRITKHPEKVLFVRGNDTYREQTWAGRNSWRGWEQAAQQLGITYCSKSEMLDRFRYPAKYL